MQYDLTILGNDEAAFETAMAANDQGLKTLVVVSDTAVSAWQKTRALQHLASELMAEAIDRHHSLNHRSLVAKYEAALQTELQEFNTSLRTAGIDVLNATAEFESAKAVRLTFPDFTRPVTINSHNVVVATGVQRTAFPFCDKKDRLDAADAILGSAKLPQHARVIGGGDFGAALAACLQLSGVATQLISRIQHDSATLELASSCGVDIADHPDDFDSSETIDGEAIDAEQQVIDCRGHHGLTHGLKLGTIAVEADEHGQLWCGRHFETWCRGVYGVGDVVGFSPDSTMPVVTQAEMVIHRICIAQQPTSGSSRLTAALVLQN